MAKANTSNGDIILVYRYAPSGNYMGEFVENVKPPPGIAFIHTASLLVCWLLSISSIILGLDIF